MLLSFEHNPRFFDAIKILFSNYFLWYVENRVVGWFFFFFSFFLNNDLVSYGFSKFKIHSLVGFG